MLRSGTPNTDVAAALRIPRGTIGWWLHQDRRRSGDLDLLRSRIRCCPRCNGAPLNRRSYAYLLGLYLGDGHIIDKKSQHTLSVTCANAWPGLMDECEAAMTAVMPANRVWRRKQVGCHDVMSSSTHWKCLFPQHGPGRKHERAIVLEPWQQEIVDDFPGEFIRGLIHSDGCRVYNVAVRTRNGKTTRYHYSRYHFTNESAHIRELFTDTLDKLGIEWRYNTPKKNISIARRESVRKLDSFVGPKY
jgi:hypothetical protein